MAARASSTREVKLKALESGVKTGLPAGGILTVNGQPYTQAQLAAKLDGYLSLFDALASARTATSSALLALKAALPEAQGFETALVSVLRQFFGVHSPQLAGFGIDPPKIPLPRTAGQKAIAAAKAAATRKARGVLGTRQRAAIAAPTAAAQLVLDTSTGKAIGAAPAPVTVFTLPPSTK